MLQLQPIATATAATTTATAAPEPELMPCGWFDSSWELRQGLEVIEHPCADGVARLLGLDGWLVLQGLVANRKRSCAMMAG